MSVSTQERSLSIEWWSIAKVRPYPGNPRHCPKSAVEKVRQSIAAYGWRQPIVVDAEGTVVVGHTRLLAAKKLGLASVPVHVAADLTPEQAKAYRLADNRTGEETAWDLELLQGELAGLFDLGCDLSPLGFDAAELASIMAGPTLGLTDPDAVPAPPAEPISRPGDLWQLGKHRLLCGDSTKPEDVARLMDGRRAGLMATDPPYLVDYTGGSHPASTANKGVPGRDKHWDDYVDHEHAIGFYVDFLSAALDGALRDDAAIYQCFGIMRSTLVWEAWAQVGLLAHQVVIWKKTRAVLTYSWFLWDYEPIMVGWREGHQPARKPAADARAVWEIASAGEAGDPGGEHPTCKPVDLVRRPILYHTLQGEIIYEPFSGSGTAIIAAESTGRVCYAMELSPTFVDVAVARWQAFAGKEAIRRG
jgi:DNA modification methylase